MRFGVYLQDTDGCIVLNSQETFDDAVRDNMELGMDRDEAVKDAIEQFELQGVNTSGLKTDSVTE